MTDRVTVGNLRVARVLYDFVNNEALPGTDIDPDTFWSGVDKVVADLTPKNEDLLARRDDLQARIDKWHRQRVIEPIDAEAYRQFLTEIGYLLPEPDDFTITTAGVDDEITTTAGPQLVVPILNARFALNAANARWGSLYDALYGTDVIPEDDGAEKGDQLQPGPRRQGHRLCPSFPRRRRAVGVRRVERSDRAADRRRSAAGRRSATGCRPASRPPNSSSATPANSAHPHGRCCCATTACTSKSWSTRSRPSVRPTPRASRTSCWSPRSPRSWTSRTRWPPSTPTTRCSVTATGSGLNRGDLTEEVTKGGKTFTRVLNEDRTYTTPDGEGELTLPGRSLLFVRNVGHLMTNDAIVFDGTERRQRGARGHPGRAVHQPDRDPRIESRRRNGPKVNSRTGSIYIVKPKMHGPDEVAFTVELFSRVEDVLGLPPNTIKIGIMDEERRTTLNLKACIKAAADRVVFINTGFLDRTGDEIHTSMEAGPMIRKGAMKSSQWIKAYEDQNVDVGLATGFSGKAQIGKGMWAMTELMADMVEQKIGQPKAGATTAWVPSPTAATLHAMHYHEVDVYAVHKELEGEKRTTVDAAVGRPAGQGAGVGAGGNP